MEKSLAHRLKLIDAKIKLFELPSFDEPVKMHMRKAVELSQEKLTILGTCPKTVAEAEYWKRNKNEVEEALTIQLQSERRVEGLVNPWHLYLYRENLRRFRSRVAHGIAGDPALPMTLEEIGMQDISSLLAWFVVVAQMLQFLHAISKNLLFARFTVGCTIGSDHGRSVFGAGQWISVHMGPPISGAVYLMPDLSIEALKVASNQVPCWLIQFFPCSCSNPSIKKILCMQ